MIEAQLTVSAALPNHDERVGNGRALIDRQCGTGENSERDVGRDILAVQRIAGADDVDLVVVDQRAVFEEVTSLQVQNAVDRHRSAGNATSDARAVVGVGAEHERRGRFDRDLAAPLAVRIGDVDQDVERAAQEIDQPGVGDAGQTLDIAAQPEIERAGVDDHALIKRHGRTGLVQQFHQAVDGDRSGVVEPGVFVEVEVRSDGQ